MTFPNNKHTYEIDLNLNGMTLTGSATLSLSYGPKNGLGLTPFGLKKINLMEADEVEIASDSLFELELPEVYQDKITFKCIFERFIVAPSEKPDRKNKVLWRTLSRSLDIKLGDADSLHHLLKVNLRLLSEDEVEKKEPKSKKPKNYRYEFSFET